MWDLIVSVPDHCLSSYYSHMFTQKHSKNEELVVINIIDLLIINYDIVLSTVLFGYGTFICINKIDIIL